METMKYCAKCGNTGIIPGTGEICSCRWDADTFFNGTSCVDIPPQYQGLVFNKSLVPTDVGDKYSTYLDNLYTEITTRRMQYKNVLICSPHQHSKSLLAYCCIERLFRGGAKVFPVIDIMEVRNILQNIDTGRPLVYDFDTPVNLIEAPYLFVKVPIIPTRECFDTWDTLMGRRVRKGNCTIFLYSGKWGNLLYNDRTDLLKQIKGDGSYKTLEVKNFEYVEEVEE